MAWCGTSKAFALYHVRTWHYLYGTLRKGEKASLGQNPTQPRGLRRSTPGLVHRHHQHWGLAGECWVRDLHTSVQGPESRGGRSSGPWDRQPGAHTGNLPGQFVKCSLGRCLTKTLSGPTDTKFLTRLCHRESWEAKEELWCFRSDKSRDLEGQVTLRVKVNDKTVRLWQDKGHWARRAEFQTWWTQNWAEIDGECGLEKVLLVPKLKRLPSDLKRTHMTKWAILYRQLSNLNPFSRSLAVE